MPALSNLATIRQGLSRSGRSIGARSGATQVQLVSGSDIRDERIVVRGLPSVSIDLNGQTEKHLLKPYDVIVTGKSTAVKTAFVPSNIGRAVANSTLLVVHPEDADLGLYLWWFFTSRPGHRMLQSRMVSGSTLSSLLPSALESIDVPIPSQSKLRIFAQLIEASERAYEAATEAAQIRRTLTRDRIISEIIAAAKEKEGAAHAAD